MNSCQLNRFKLAIFAVLTLSLIDAAFTQAVKETLDSHCQIDWLQLTVFSTGNSALVGQDRSDKVEALEKARISAADNLLQGVLQVMYNNEQSIGDLVAGQSALDAELRKAVRRFTINDTRSMSDMSVEMDIELPLKEHVLPFMLSDDVGRADLRLNDEPLCPTCGQPWPMNRPVPEGLALIIPSEGHTAVGGKPFSGLVIDATGLNVKPALIPRIVDEEGREVYGTGFIDRETALKMGVVGYVRSAKQAMGDPRAGHIPFVIRGLQASGKNLTDVVVSNTDALLIHAAAKKHNFLKECKVIIIIG